MTRPEGRFQGPLAIGCTQSISLPRRLPDRVEAVARAYLSGAYTIGEIGRHFGVRYMTVSRAVKGSEWRKRQVAEGRDG